MHVYVMTNDNVNMTPKHVRCAKSSPDGVCYSNKCWHKKKAEQGFILMLAHVAQCSTLLAQQCARVQS